MFQEDKSIGMGLTPANPIEPWRQILLDAAKYLRKYGWQQGSYGFFKEGPTCAVGAMVFGRRHGIINSVLPIQVEDTARIFCKFLNTYSIPEWNDSPNRTANDVINALEACARQP